MLKSKHIQILFSSVLALLFFLSFFYEVKIGVFIGIVSMWLVLTIWGSFDVSSQYFVKTYNNNPKVEQKKIAITFDDGPTEYTASILNILKKYNVKATFFCVGIQIEKNPAVVERIISDGHIVGNHTYSHSNGIGFFSTKKVIEEIQKNDKLIKSIIGKSPLLFRPPFGVTNPRFARAIASTKHKVIGWNIRSLDTVINDEKKIVKRIKRKIKPGGIVLLHDTSSKTANALEQLLLFLKLENYVITPLDELLNIKSYED